jgi:hypothetical protein
LRTHDLKTTNSNQLCLVRESLESSISSFLSAGNFVKARDYIILSREIEKEMSERKRTEPSNRRPHPLVLYFDRESDIAVKEIRERTARLLNELADLWNTEFREKYFAPSERLARLRKAARQYPNDAELEQDLKDLKEQEEAIAQLNFETDFEAARNQVFERGEREVSIYLRSRRKDRALLLAELATRPSIASVKSRALRRTVPVHPISRSVVSVKKPVPRAVPQSAPVPDQTESAPNEVVPSAPQQTFVTGPGGKMEDDQSTSSSDERVRDPYDPIADPQAWAAAEPAHAEDDEEDDRAGLMYGSEDQIVVNFVSGDSSSLFDSTHDIDASSAHSREVFFQESVGQDALGTEEEEDAAEEELQAEEDPAVPEAPLAAKEPAAVEEPPTEKNGPGAAGSLLDLLTGGPIAGGLNAPGEEEDDMDEEESGVVVSAETAAEKESSGTSKPVVIREGAEESADATKKEKGSRNDEDELGEEVVGMAVNEDVSKEDELSEAEKDGDAAKENREDAEFDGYVDGAGDPGMDDRASRKEEESVDYEEDEDF